MEIGNYVQCSRKLRDERVVVEHGQIVASRVSKYNRHQKLYSVQTKSGVFLSSILNDIREMKFEDIPYLALHPKNHKKGIEYKLAKRDRLLSLKIEQRAKCAAKRMKSVKVEPVKPVKAKKAKTAK